MQNTPSMTWRRICCAQHVIALAMLAACRTVRIYFPTKGTAGITQRASFHSKKKQESALSYEALSELLHCEHTSTLLLLLVYCHMHRCVPWASALITNKDSKNKKIADKRVSPIRICTKYNPRNVRRRFSARALLTTCILPLRSLGMVCHHYPHFWFRSPPHQQQHSSRRVLYTIEILLCTVFLATFVSEWSCALAHKRRIFIFLFRYFFFVLYWGH